MRLLILCLALMQPTQGTSSAGADGKDDIVTLRMRLNEDGERGQVAYTSVQGCILFFATINGRPVTMLLDNGAARTVIDTGFARKAGIGTRPLKGGVFTSAGTLIDVGATDAVELVVPRGFRVAGPMMSADLRPVTTALGRPVDAVLGSDVLGQFAVLVDPNNRRLAFYHGGATTATGGTVAVPIADGTIVAAELNGQKVGLRIDLGSTGTVSLSDAAWRRVIPAGSPIRGGENTSVDGVTRRTRFAEAALRIGPVRIDRAWVGNGYVPTRNADGLLGNGFLSRGPILLDLKGRQLLLLPRQRAAKNFTPAP